MNLKTEYTYNEDDFIENNGELRELTVTITLCEYRNLITERAYNEKAIEQLQEENEKLRKQNDALNKVVIEKCPEIIVGIETMVKGLSLDDEETEAQEDEK